MGLLNYIVGNKKDGSFNFFEDMISDLGGIE